MSEALAQTRGMVYLAAKRLHCDVNTVLRYCKRYPSVEDAKVAARGEFLDMAELKLWAAVQAGEHWAVTFALRTVGRDRGYSEHVALHLTIERAAARVAGQFGLTVEEVLDEAKLLLEECDHGG
jgi:hypothetical protein